MTRLDVLRHNALQLLIALDQLVNAATGAVLALLRWLHIWRRPVGLWWGDETISAHSWRWYRDGIRHWPARMLDWVAQKCGDENHCYESYESERKGRHLAPEYRPFPAQGRD